MKEEIWLKIFDGVMSDFRGQLSSMDWDEEKFVDALYDRVIKRTNEIFKNVYGES